ncbi:MAG: flavin monoamine oxidase family protein, partial [Beijerinckiaceae bacterium]
RVAEVYDEIDESNDISFAAALRREPPDVQNAGRIQAKNAAGEEPQFISVADWQQLASGANLIVPGGYGTLAESIAAPLAVRTGVRVTEIDWSGGGVTVKTGGGDIRARAVIVTVSVGVLQENGIRFTPSLPAESQRALAGLRMGALTKIALHFEGARFGFEPHQFLAEIGQVAEAMTFECWPQDQNLVVGVAGGDHGRALTRAGEQAAIAFALDTFAAMAGSDVRGAFKAGRLAGWAADPLTRGSYAVVLPGRTKAREALARPIANRIWIAGEATAGMYSMTAGGATLAGQAAADDIVMHALRNR